MPPAPTNLRSILKHPIALLPLAMSLAALTVVLAHVAISGPAREPDEGAAAHISLLIALQLPLIAFFSNKVAAASPQADPLCPGDPGGSRAGRAYPRLPPPPITGHSPSKYR